MCTAPNVTNGTILPNETMFYMSQTITVVCDLGFVNVIDDIGTTESTSVAECTGPELWTVEGAIGGYAPLLACQCEYGSLV